MDPAAEVGRSRIPLLWPLREGQVPQLGSHALDSRVRALAAECGCTAGGVASLTALAAYFVVRAVALPVGPGHLMRAWLTGAAVVVAAAVLAKTLAIAIARIRLRRILAALPLTPFSPP